MSKGISAIASLAVIAVAVYAAPLHSEDAPKTMTEHSERMCSNLHDLKDAFIKSNEGFAAVTADVGQRTCEVQRNYIRRLEAEAAAAKTPAPTQVSGDKPVRDYAAETKAMLEKVWYEPTYTKPAPTTLQGAIAAEKEFLGSDNPYWTGHGGGDVVCNALKAVRLSCDYNTRITLSMFLTVNGKGLFPAAGGTNPYYTKRDANNDRPDDGFIGQPKQNEMLAKAVTRNAKLFKNGDISVDVVKKFWK